MVVIAKFKGKDGSKGYKRGKTYELFFAISHPGCSVVDRNDDKVSTVVYSSMVKFLDNWEVIK